ncbi:MAG: MarR family transcriptional regulator [Fimbriimonadaceae bacterium]|nr:MarR family transcriptional regulator [Fimbriimonadaceae bacterium]
MQNNLLGKQFQAWRLFNSSHSTATFSLDSSLKAAGKIPLDTYEILSALSESPHNRLRMSELADKIVFSRSGLSRKIDRLEKSGVVKREPSPDDRRGWFAVITEEGIAAHKSAKVVHDSHLEKIWSSVLSDHESTVLSQILDKVASRAAK